LTSLLPVIHVSPFQRRENVQEKKTPDTSGPTSLTSLEQLDLFGASLKTSKDTSALDCERSLQIWKKLVIQRRGEYSARLKLAYAKNIQKVSTREKESSLWLTPMVQDSKHSGTNPGPNGKRKLLVNQVNWPTATVFYVTGGSYPTELVNGQWRSKHSKDPNSPWYGAKLRDAVETAEKMNWPTPTAHEARLGYQDRSDPTKKGTQESLTTVVVNRAGGRSECTGHLNPEFCEWLMGVPTGWTELGSWGMVSYQQQPQKRGEC